MENKPNKLINTEAVFGVVCNFEVYGFKEPSEHVPEIDYSYRFDPETTTSILAGFANNRRVLVQGYHGTGKSTHIEQVAARLNWPCIRINLDSHISRIDLIGKDAIVLKDGKQITEFQDGILPWAYVNPVALVFDEYDAGRPDVMFVIQRILETDGKLTLLDQSRVIKPNKYFRLFATANTVGKEIIKSMVATADLSRSGFINGDISTVMSPRTVLTWAENYLMFNNIEYAFKLSFLNRCDELERPIIEEYFQRSFGINISDTKVANVKE